MSYKYFFMRFPGGKEKAITLSYDDGVEQDEKLIGLMEEYGFKGTFNLNAGCIAPEGKVYEPGRVHRRMSLSQIERVYSSENVEIAIHAFTHPYLEKLPAACVMDEIVNDRKGLEKIFGGVIRGMAYPYGTYNDQVVEILRMAGICYSRTTHSTEKFDLPADWLRLPATCHHTNPRLMALADEFEALEVKKEPKMFYLWGHAYEFEGDNNWPVIEAFFQKMGGNSSIWYATNIEIYDYVQAFKRLAFSADGSRVYNSSAIDLWLGNNDKVICVPAGKTVDLV